MTLHAHCPQLAAVSRRQFPVTPNPNVGLFLEAQKPEFVLRGYCQWPWWGRHLELPFSVLQKKFPLEKVISRSRQGASPHHQEQRSVFSPGAFLCLEKDFLNFGCLSEKRPLPWSWKTTRQKKL